VTGHGGIEAKRPDGSVRTSHRTWDFWPLVETPRPPKLGFKEGCAVIDETTRDEVLRERAMKRLRKRRDFYGHLLVYVLVNSFLVVIWALTDVHGFFWPVFPIVGWGIGVVMNAWDVFRNEEFDEQQIQREVERLQRRG